MVLHYTIKPNIYGGIAARLAGIPSVNNVSGLGTVFLVRNLVSRVALGLNRFAFRFPARVFFQNADDRQLFLDNGLVAERITDLVPGSGIDTQKFRPAAAFVRRQPFVFLMIARVLYEKGVAEYFEAARLVRAAVPRHAGAAAGRRRRVGRSRGEAGGAGRVAGRRPRRVPGHLRRRGRPHCPGRLRGAAQLPRGHAQNPARSRRHGQTLVTTDVPGCRETVRDGENGLLCEVRNAPDLAAKMQQLLALPDEALQAMGRASRRLAEEKFDERLVLEKYLRVVAEVGLRRR